jgi:CheY-like chemotaxis protein
VIVDDLHDSADSLAQLMRIFGHDVTAAYDGVEAITLAAKLRPDVMLIDIGMPGMSGHQVCQHIRRQPGGEDIFLIAVTGWGQPSDRELTEAAGFDSHLVKPVDGSALAALIGSLPSRPPVGGIKR